jgi:ribosomal protein S18 acetylase RimI-like enzyme
VIVYRHFKNQDVPALVELWNACDLGSGAARRFSSDSFDQFVLAEPYFDRRALIEAWHDGQLVGCVHAGFGPDSTGSRICQDPGVVCMVLVRPPFRRRGIGRRLVELAEEFLRSHGARSLQAGESLNRNPFYLGLYGGADSAGFLETDPLARPFFEMLGYRPAETYRLMSRELQVGKLPFDPRMVALRKSVRLNVLDRPPASTWWWLVRHGRFDSLTFTLSPPTEKVIPGIVTCWGMDLHTETRGRRTVGITDLYVTESVRRKGYAKALLCEVLRFFREDGVADMEVVVPEGNAAAQALFDGLGFVARDRGTVYQKPFPA